MSVLAPLLTSGAAKAAGGALFGGLLGGTRRGSTPKFTPTGIQTGGLDLGIAEGKISGGSTKERLGRITGLSELFGKQAGEIRGLRGKVAPGISELRQARLGNVRSRKQQAIGDLSANLQRRRVLGSSFGEDALSRSRAEFSQQEDRIIAETFLQELESTRQLIGEEFNLGRQSIQVFLDNMNVEAGIATQLASGATDALSKNAQVQAQILNKEQSDIFELFTDIGGGIFENITGGGFKPGAGPTATGQGG